MSRIEAEDLFARAVASQEAGDNDDALRLYAESLASFPDHESAFVNLWWLNRYLGRRREASELVRQKWPNLEDFGRYIGPRAYPSGPVVETPWDPDLIAASLGRYGACLLKAAISKGLLFAVGSAFLDRASDAQRASQVMDRDLLAEMIPPPVVLALGAMGLKPDLSLCYYREVASEIEGSTVPYHQDILAFGRPCANLWVPFGACGVDAPGLEVVAVRQTEIIETRGRSFGDYAELEITGETISERFAREDIWTPQMEEGDALLFLGTTIHRTAITTDMTRRRSSLELRFSE